MKKAFVWDPSMRSSALKYDPCIEPIGKKYKMKCSDCKVTLISDRFLGKEFQEEILGNLGKSRSRYPFALIADTLGCNLKCWFCYAYKFIDKKTALEYDCEISYITPNRLAEQFACKIQKLSDFNALIRIAQEKEKNDPQCRGAVNHLNMKLPLMRIRISGGEPIFSTKETLLDDEFANDITISTVNFWLDFFREFDRQIGKLKKEGKIAIIDKEAVKNKEWKGDLPFPTCLAERPGRINIRFDTNGIIFGRKEITDAFIGGIFSLFKQNRLNNIFVEIDYSFKGPTPIEYWWSQKKKLPVESSKISFDFGLEEHPQWKGYKNITETIETYCKNDKEFWNCVGITVERGINHNMYDRTFVYFKEALNWDHFSKKTGIKFSVVDNPIEMFNWRNRKPKPYLIKNGANIKIITIDGEEFDLSKNPSIYEFDDFRKLHKSRCQFLIYPFTKEIVLSNKLNTDTEIISNKKTIAGWVFSGSPENWELAIKKGIWGVKERHKYTWSNVKPGDLVLIYVTKPYSKIIGISRVDKLIVDNSPIWPDEISEKKAKYPLRIKLAEIKVVNDWKKGLRVRNLNVKHGINPIYDQDLHLIEKIKIYFDAD